MNPKPLANLHPAEYEHPFDRKALDAMQAIPGMDAALRQLDRKWSHKSTLVNYKGSHLRVTAELFPEVHAIFAEACQVLNVPVVPELYVQQNSTFNAFAVGTENPLVCITTHAVDVLDDDCLLALLGHELGHVKSRHAFYRQIADILGHLGMAVGTATLGIGSILSLPLQLALWHWSRMSEFTADRAGLLTCQDSETVIRLLMTVAGLPRRYAASANTGCFVNQAREFQDLDYDAVSNLFKTLSQANAAHPWTVMRAAELLKWLESGEYQQVCDRATGYLATYKSEGQRWACRSCGFLVDGGEKFCPSCGTQLQPK